MQLKLKTEPPQGVRRIKVSGAADTMRAAIRKQLGECHRAVPQPALHSDTLLVNSASCAGETAVGVSCLRELLSLLIILVFYE